MPRAPVPIRPGAAVAAAIAVAVLAGACSSGSSRATPPTTVAPVASAQPGTSGSTVWLCRPGATPDPCAGDLTATVEAADGSTSTQSSLAARRAPVDCFYVYPTVSTEPTANADLVIQPAEIAAAKAQASRFSQMCRVWAPMYRQQTAADLDRSGLSGDQSALAVAYTSVLSAWRDYLAHDNDGRPVVFIGHSQGAAILIRLLASQIDPVAARRAQMVSAIILGGNVQVPSGQTVGGSFQHIPACASAAQLHCVIAYSSFDSQPPPTALFGRPGQGVSLQSDQRTSTGQQVLCTNPAALGGGTGTLEPYFLAAGRKIRGAAITTPWVTYPVMYSAQCRTENGATWLQVTAVGGATDPRPKVTPNLGPRWGLHGNDMNLALGNLIGLVGDQVRADRP